jgi:uncharacterized protein YdaU (DUF1376 family)
VGSNYPTEKRSLPSCRSFFQGELEHETAMHYYQFNIGDYNSHTMHLSETEDLAFRRMLDWSYLHEKPLPVDLDEIARQIRMRTHSESIGIVLNEYFELREDGWINLRVIQELLKVGIKSEKASASAKARWGKKDANALPTQSDSNATHNTLPITHNTKEKNKKGSRLSQDWFLSKSMGEWATQERPDLDVRQVAEQFKDYWVAQAGQKGVKLDWDATWRNWVRNTKAVKPNPYDVGRLTVPSKNEPNLALLKIEEDAKKAAPIPLEVLAKMAQIRQKA